METSNNCKIPSENMKEQSLDPTKINMNIWKRVSDEHHRKRDVRRLQKIHVVQVRSNEFSVVVWITTGIAFMLIKELPTTVRLAPKAPTQPSVVRSNIKRTEHGKQNSDAVGMCFVSKLVFLYLFLYDIELSVWILNKWCKAQWKVEVQPTKYASWMRVKFH